MGRGNARTPDTRLLGPPGHRSRPQGSCRDLHRGKPRSASRLPRRLFAIALPVLTHPVAQEPGSSFPSGHAQAAIVGYALLLLVFLPILHGAWRRVAVTFAAFMVLAVGFSRIALGVHYVSDVIGSYVLGAAWVAAMAAAFNAMRVDRGRRSLDVGEGLEPEQARLP
jgi:membrane-associated phospholipid phosphatase